MKKTILSGVMAVATLILSACSSTTTPQNRIEENLAVYNALPAKEQQLVSQGKLCAGMSPQAVFLAWGYPNTAPYVGNKQGKKVVRWVYTRMQPVLTMNNWAGPNWGPYGWYDPIYRGESTTYIPRNAATAVFEDDKLVSWESNVKNP